MIRRLIALTLLFASPVMAQDAAVNAAQADGTVGEQADGYLGLHGAPSPDVRALVEQINSKRRAVYTDMAAKKGVSIGDVAGATACQILESVGPGQWWRDAAGAWHQHSDSPIPKPSYCG